MFNFQFDFKFYYCLHHILLIIGLDSNCHNRTKRNGDGIRRGSPAPVRHQRSLFRRRAGVESSRGCQYLDEDDRPSLTECRLQTSGLLRRLHRVTEIGVLYLEYTRCHGIACI